MAVHAIDLVLAEEELDAFRALRNDGILVLEHSRHVELDLRHVHALVGGLLRVLVELGGVQDRLGGNASA